MEDPDVPSTPASGNAIDGKVLELFQERFPPVQTILDHNQVLIREICHNHESNVPEKLKNNVGLIRELNNNISRVVELYANLSAEFMKAMEEEPMGAASQAAETATGSPNDLPFPAKKKIRHE